MMGRFLLMCKSSMCSYERQATRLFTSMLFVMLSFGQLFSMVLSSSYTGKTSVYTEGQTLTVMYSMFDAKFIPYDALGRMVKHGANEIVIQDISLNQDLSIKDAYLLGLDIVNNSAEAITNTDLVALVHIGKDIVHKIKISYIGEPLNTGESAHLDYYLYDLNYELVNSGEEVLISIVSGTVSNKEL